MTDYFETAFPPIDPFGAVLTTLRQLTYGRKEAK